MNSKQNKKIPKIIHFIWIGDKPMGKLENKAIRTWKKKAKDYEFILWNEKNFDFSNNEFATQAFNDKKYAFVSDYIRLSVLAQYGGVYLDTDMFAIDDFNHIVDDKAELQFAPFDDRQIFGTSFIGSVPNQAFILDALELYENLAFDSGKMIANTELLSNLFENDKGKYSEGVVINDKDEIYHPGLHSKMIHVGTASWIEPNLNRKVNIFLRSKITSKLGLYLLLPIFKLAKMVKTR